MLDHKIIRENPQAVKESIINRRMGDGTVVDKIIDLDTRSLAVLRDLEAKRALRNTLS